MPDPPQDGILVRDGLVIPESELHVRFTRSGGPGGQNVNKVATRVELEFDVAGSRVLSLEDKEHLLARLRTRITSAGVVRVVGQRFRSQARNEADARERLAALLAHALERPVVRRPTRVSRAVRRARLDSKRRRSEIKQTRRPARTDSD